MVHLAEHSQTPRLPENSDAAAKLTGTLELFRNYGHLLVALVGSVAFVIVKPPVADLQAADARAGAAGRHVGLGYWLSWFGGSTPGQYSVLTPAVASVVGVTTLAALSVMVIALVARPLLAGTNRPRSAAFLMVVCALCNLWSGRVPFSVGMAVSLVGLLMLIHRNSVLGGVVNGIATLFSPLATAFILLAIVGPAVTKRDWRKDLIRFAIPSVIGLLLPTIFFGAPSPMPFAATTLAWSVGIVLAAALLDLPRPLKFSLYAAALACLGAFVIPSGVGANISRYSFLLLPPIVWAMARNPKRVIVLALLPAFVYSGYNVASDIAEAAKPAAQPTYYQGLRTELLKLPGRDNHRIEVLDTATHRAAADLIPDIYLARGWETQSDSTNALFYNPSLLNSASYRRWLDEKAVSWVAVPTQPGGDYQAEATLVNAGLPYLHEVWRDAQWTLYSVSSPEAIVPAPATVVESTETQVVFDLTQPATLTLRLRPARFIKVTSADGLGPPVCLTSTNPDEIQAIFPTSGRYVVSSGFSVNSAVNRAGC
ncbi:MAG TPA: hypothetical protein VGH11_15555 [Jatrophihabitans sp.]|jgi:hypothetical protein